jgi:hypothetical protein
MPKIQEVRPSFYIVDVTSAPDAFRASLFRRIQTKGINSVRANAKNGIPPLLWIQWFVKNLKSTWFARSVIVMIRKAFLTTVIGKTASARMSRRDKVHRNR